MINYFLVLTILSSLILMTVQKIIYVTPGETHLGELTHAAESQLKEIVANVLE